MCINLLSSSFVYFPVLGCLSPGCSLLPLRREQLYQLLGNHRDGTQDDGGVNGINRDVRGRENSRDYRRSGRPSETDDQYNGDQYTDDQRHLYDENEYGQSKEDVEERSDVRADGERHERNRYGYSGKEYKQGGGGYGYGHNDDGYGGYGHNNGNGYGHNNGNGYGHNNGNGYGQNHRGNGYGHNDNYGHRGGSGYGYGRSGQGSYRGGHGGSGYRNSRRGYHKNQYRPVYTKNIYLPVNGDFQVFSITTAAPVVATTSGPP